MPISYHSSSKTFHLYNSHISYIMMVLPNGHLGHLYFGKALHDRESFEHLLELRNRSMAVCTFEGDLSFSLEHLLQEYPCFGSGDMREPAFDISMDNGSHISDFRYASHIIKEGKPPLPDLPHTFVDHDHQAYTLEITLKDTIMHTTMILSYTLFEQLPIITRHVCFKHEGNSPITLHKAMSLNLDLPDSHYELVELTGAWARERHVKVRPLEHGITAFGSKRGHSSSNFNPFMMLKRPHTTEISGEAIGISFVYSGNFLAQVEVDTYDVSRISIGIHPQNFSWTLEKNDSFTTPEAILAYSDQGLNHLSQQFHTLFLNHLSPKKWRNRPAPILVNNWEGTYFDFNEERIIDMAKTAKSLGIELFVLDDGWFGHRDDDTTSLGDWYPYLKKLPHGLKSLACKIKALGLDFGLWIEPEMISKDSDLYRRHPEMMLHTPQRHDSHGRNQYILDFSNPLVVDTIYHMLENTFKDVPIDYIKWDMNRSMSEVYSTALPAHQQGQVMHRYILGVYHLYERLIQRFPHILFESCSSGGARFDPGMFYYAPQAWTSDDTDAIERLKIQYGTSFAYPIRFMGSHVSASPNHQLHRFTPLKTRGDVAYFGTFGYELDVNQLSDEEKTIVIQQIEWMKEHRSLIQYGTFYRLSSPFEQDTCAWMVVSKDQNDAIVGYYRPLNKINSAYTRLPLLGLDPDKLYGINQTYHYGDELMHYGLITSDESSGLCEHEDPSYDYYSKIYVLKAKSLI